LVPKGHRPGIDALLIGLLSLVALVTGTPFVFPSLGPTAFLFFFDPRAPSASPHHAMIGHAIGIACGQIEGVFQSQGREVDAHGGDHVVSPRRGRKRFVSLQERGQVAALQSSTGRAAESARPA